jgi:ribonuclease HI
MSNTLNTPKQYLAFVDGGCLKNGSHLAEAYGSYKVYDISTFEALPGNDLVLTMTPCLEQIRFPVHHKSGRVTNNIAEATAMFMLISSLHRLGYFQRGRVQVCCDSLLVINQLLGLYATKDENLLTIHRQTFKVFAQIQEGLGPDKVMADVLVLTKISGDDMKVVLGH